MSYVYLPNNSIVSPARRVSGLNPYRPPRHDRQDMMRLDANEGAPPSPQICAVLRSITAEALCRYPDASTLESAIATSWGITPERVVVTNGGDDAIDRVCRAVLEPGRTMLLHTPTFKMIERYAHLAYGSVRLISWFDGSFPTEQFIAAIDFGTRLIAIVSPNNPTGGVVPLEVITAVAAAAKQVGAVVLLDFAYVEFADHDPTAVLLDAGNIVIVRTFSKALGLAGLRVGYAIAPPKIASWLRAVGGPYPVTCVSLKLAEEMFANIELRSSFITVVQQQRDELVTTLQECGAMPMPSQANFVIARFDDVAALQQRLSETGIAVRGFGSDSGLSEYLRITVPGDKQLFGKLQLALRGCAE